MTKIKLGDKVRDQVTGFQGVATARTHYLHGDDRIIIQPSVDVNGEHTESVSFEESSVKKIGKQDVPGYNLKK